VLRIEDTDMERSTRESEHSLVEDLRWLGVDWDEGPDCGGDFAPYRQSQRIEWYGQQAEELLANDLAYPCFCSDELLEAKRREAIKEAKPPQYDGTCRGLSVKEIEDKRSRSVPEVIRFNVPDGVVRFRDLVRGDIEFATNTVGDFVLIRSNGRPTYNFAAALDDHAMSITHVLRGEEHLPNTLRQILIYAAFQARLPEFAHLPLILAEDRSKLSKRHGASSIGDLRSLGFLPPAVVNYLVLLGWSHPDGKEILQTAELIRSFSVERVNKSAAVFDKQKLRWMNGHYIREASVEKLFETADRFFPSEIRSSYPQDVRKKILELLHDGLENLGDLAEAAAPFRSPPDFDGGATEAVKSANSIAVLSALRELLVNSRDDLTSADFKSMMKEVGKKTSLKGKDLFFPVRAALTGSVHGPDLAGVAVIKGREEVIGLIERAQAMGDSR